MRQGTGAWFQSRRCVFQISPSAMRTAPITQTLRGTKNDRRTQEQSPTQAVQRPRSTASAERLVTPQ